MINHARTLLLNRAGDARPAASFFLEEYVDPTYRPVHLRQNLIDLYRVLLGERSDDIYVNFRLRQYMQLLHSTEFASYIYALDPRVTYLSNRKVQELTTGITVVPKSTAGASTEFFFEGTPEPTGALKFFQSWLVEIKDPTTIDTTSLQEGFYNTNTVSITNSLSTAFTFAGQLSFGARVVGSSLPTGGRWNIESVQVPSSDVTDVVDGLLALGRGSALSVFSDIEPYKTFKELWEYGPSLSYRLSGFLLAYIYRVEEIRLHA